MSNIQEQVSNVFKTKFMGLRQHFQGVIFIVLIIIYSISHSKV